LPAIAPNLPRAARPEEGQRTAHPSAVREAAEGPGRQPAVRVEAFETHAARASVAPVEVHAQSAVRESMLHHGHGPGAQRGEADALAQRTAKASRRVLTGREIAPG
jgi:hypothetical protein